MTRSPVLPRYWRWVAAGAALALAGLAVAYLPGHAGWRPAAFGTRRPAAVRPPAGSVTVKPAGAGKLIAAAAPPPPSLPPPLAHALTGWTSGPGGTAMAALTSAVGGATQAGGLQFYAPMRQACAQVSAAVAAAKASAPIPDATLQRHYAAALASFAKAAADCESAISVRPDGDEDLQTSQNQPVLQRSRAEFVSGSGDLFGATAKIQALILSR